MHRAATPDGATRAIRPAGREEAEALSALALRSKAYWGYDQDFLEAVRETLTISAANFDAGSIYALELNGGLAGFYYIVGRPPEGELSDLWLDPQTIGRGFGRELFRHALETAAAQGFETLLIESDPNAAGFYLAMGAERVGDRRSNAGRWLPLLRVTVPSGEARGSLLSERLSLEPLREEHRPVWRRLCSHDEVMRHIGSGGSWDSARADETFDRALAHWCEHGFGRRAVRERKSSQWIGFASLNYVGPGAVEVPREEIEIGCLLFPSAWGRGYASEAVHLLFGEAFARVKLQRIIARTNTANRASARAVAKSGMRLEREALGRHGERVAIYELTRAEWLTLRRAPQVMSGRTGDRPGAEGPVRADATRTRPSA